MTHIELRQQRPVETPRGKGWAIVLIDRSQDHNLEWVCIIDATGECWTFQNDEIRFQQNMTMRRRYRPSAPSSSHL